MSAAVALVVCVALMASADVGYLYYIKREMQKAADLAALAGAQTLPNPCTAATAAATLNMGTNLRSTRFSAGPTLQVACGSWTPSAGATAAAGQALADGGRYFTAGASNPNAVQAIISGNFRAFMLGSRPIRVSAVSVREQPLAAITLGTALANLKLGGLDVSVLSPDGGARITLSGLLGQLGIPVDANIGVAQLNGLLAANNVSVAQLMTASANLLPQAGNALAVQLRGFANTINADAVLSKQRLVLGGPGNGLFANLTTSSVQESISQAQAALNAELKVADIVSAAAAIANGGNAVSVPGLTLPGIAIKAAVVSPPSVAVGPVGTVARNAQVRVFIDIDSNAIPVVNLVAAVLDTRIRLPLYLDVMRGRATITNIDCTAAPRTVDVRVDSRILGACMGTAAPATQFTDMQLCDVPPAVSSLTPVTVLRVLGHDTLTTKLSISALDSTETLTRMVAGEVRSTSNQLQIGTTLSNVIAQLSNMLAQVGTSQPAGTTSLAVTASEVAARYLAQAPKDSAGRYRIDPLVTLLANGNTGSNGTLAPLGTWNVTENVACGALGLLSCPRTVTVWESFKNSISGGNQGLVGNLVGGLLTNCSSLVGALIGTYNNCVANNLTTFLQTKPGGVTAPPGTPLAACTSLLCTALKPVTDGLSGVLNTLGSGLASTLSAFLGTQLGVSQVSVDAISCGNVRLVH